MIFLIFDQPPKKIVYKNVGNNMKPKFSFCDQNSPPPPLLFLDPAQKQ